MNEQHPVRPLGRLSASDGVAALRQESSQGNEEAPYVSVNPVQAGDIGALIACLKDAEAESDSRKATLVALAGVVDYLKTVPEIERQDLHAPVWKLAVALKDIERGAISPMFKDLHAGSCNRREAGNDIRQIKAFSSYCVELLTHLGIGLDVACRHVADGLRSAGFEVKGKTNSPPWKTVRNWRDGVSKLRPENVERDLLNELRALSPVTDGMSHAHAVQHVSGLLKRLVSKTAA